MIGLGPHLCCLLHQTPSDPNQGSPRLPPAEPLPRSRTTCERRSPPCTEAAGLTAATIRYLTSPAPASAPVTHG